jgi:hypothetical protein
MPLPVVIASVLRAVLTSATGWNATAKLWPRPMPVAEP